MQPRSGPYITPRQRRELAEAERWATPGAWAEDDIRDFGFSVEDSIFIALARRRVLPMLSEIDRLRRQVALLTAQLAAEARPAHDADIAQDSAPESKWQL